MTSSNCGGKPAGQKPGRGDGSVLSPFEDFLSDVVDLATSIDEQLAVILRGAAESRAPRLPWSRGKRQGLELCLTMLRYAREEIHSPDLGKRIDEAIAYAAVELERTRSVDVSLH